MSVRELRRVCVFCGSSPGAEPEYARTARELGRLLAARGVTLVYGGGNVGLMGVLADAVLEDGGRAIGVIPHALRAKELAHEGLTELRVVDSMHERKAAMADLADAFVAMPGGFGTFEEILEIVTWAQLGIHAKPCGLLDVRGYFTHLVDLLDHAVAERFLKPQHRGLLLVASDGEELLERLASFEMPTLAKWIDRSMT